jgi:hypothetical protein
MTQFRMSLIAIIAIAASSGSSAEPYTPVLACRSVAAIVAAKGAVVLYTSRENYDRYVRDQGQCQRDEQLKPAWAQTADNAICFIGYTCEYVFSNRR